MIELNKIYNEDCRETIKRMEDNFIDSIVTDPPYELGFMGKKWDNSGIAYNAELWKECLRVLKPGGYLLAFGGTRTSHRMVCAIEDAGFEIRDSILWLYGSGFPKSLDIGKAIDKSQGNERNIVGIDKSGSKRNCMNGNFAGGKYNLTKGISEYEGWGTALKPAHEPICVARKPIAEKTVAQNVLKYGTGGINIDGCRIETEYKWHRERGINVGLGGNILRGKKEIPRTGNESGRFPANVILDDSDVILSQFPNTVSGARNEYQYPPTGNINFKSGCKKSNACNGDSGSASRFFYCAKASKSERDEGNYHPTVKPISLMQYLQKLITPKGGITYDPFGGSGTSALSASNEGFKWILSEIDSEYCEIANKRIFNNNGLFK